MSPNCLSRGVRCPGTCCWWEDTGALQGRWTGACFSPALIFQRQDKAWETMSIPQILSGTLGGSEWGKHRDEKPPLLFRVLPPPSRDLGKNRSEGWALRRQREELQQHQWDWNFTERGFNHPQTCASNLSASPEAHFLSRTSHLVPKLSRHVSMCCTSRQWQQSSCSRRAPSSLFSLFSASEYNSFKLLWGNSYPDFIRSGRSFYFLGVFSTQRTGATVNFISVLSVF